MSNGEYQNVKIEREDGITFVMLNRPEKRNAMSPALHYEMEDALSRLETDKETKVDGHVVDNWYKLPDDAKPNSKAIVPTFRWRRRTWRRSLT